MRTLLYTGLMLALPFVTMAPFASADGAGLSGQCYDDSEDPFSAADSGGGEDELRYDTTTGPETGLDPVPGDHGITDGLLKFGLGTVEDGGQTGTACDQYDCYASAAVCALAGQDARYDYLEVDARVGSTYVQACYRGAVSVAGDCPQHPTGAG